MQDIFSNKPKKDVAKHSENYRILNALQLLQTLLIPGNNQSIDTAAEVEFLLKYRLDSIDTPMEIKELIEVLDKIKKNIPEVANKPELIKEIDDLIDKLEAACQQNRPGVNKL